MVVGQRMVDGEISGSGTDFGTALVGNKFGFGIGTPDTTIASTTAINDGSWHHVAATRSSVNGEMKIFVDGMLQGTGAGATSFSHGAAVIAHRQHPVGCRRRFSGGHD